MEENVLTNDRTCSGCTKCCEGWLAGVVKGRHIHRGKPCHFMNAEKKCCSIYEDRPQSPCRDFVCEWLVNQEIPLWMKPSLIHVIVAKSTVNNVEYFEVNEAGYKIDSAILNWFIQWALSTKKNILYTVDGMRYRIGSSEFVNARFEE